MNNNNIVQPWINTVVEFMHVKGIPVNLIVKIMLFDVDN